MSAFFYLASIVVANLLVMQYGIIHLGPIAFPAGAAVVGLTFSARDFVQKRFGKWKCWYFMGAASILTALFSWDIAFASVSAFLASEVIDWIVYTKMSGSFRKRVLVSNIFGTPIDSLIFVPLLFGWNWPAIIGQGVIKFVSSILVLPFINKNKV
jgi:uncharacterized PurR-regulated membrane protein YhhQ (DUF165 family)